MISETNYGLEIPKMAVFLKGVPFSKARHFGYPFGKKFAGRFFHFMTCCDSYAIS